MDNSPPRTPFWNSLKFQSAAILTDGIFTTAGHLVADLRVRPRLESDAASFLDGQLHRSFSNPTAPKAAASG